ncbi:MAG: TMEM175 family protein [Anaerolineae bacterium]
MSTGRIGALADGVFAIVMTLLVFGLAVPEIDAALSVSETSQQLIDGLLGQLPNLASYVLSFVILGVYWVAHHTQFQYINRADQNLLWLNILFLACVSLIPFTESIMGRYPDQRAAVILYGANLILVAISHYAVWRYATRERRLVDAQLETWVIALGRFMSLLPIGAYVFGMVLAFIHPYLSILVYALVPIPYVFGLFQRRLGVKTT